MEFLMEFIFEVILEGTFELADSKKAPKWLRIVAAVLLVVLYAGFFGVLMYAAVSSRSPLFIAVVVLAAVILTAMCVAGFIREKNKRRK